MKINNLCKSFGDNVIFDNFSIKFLTGFVTYIMGKSGVGKTTLLRIISGLDKDFRGNVEYNGTLAYVFQEPRLFPTLTVRENISVVNENPQLSVDNLLKLLELEDAKDLFPTELSGGMKMRVSIARALYSCAEIILMDEPFAALDFNMKERVAPKIFSLLEGKTVLVVSHDLNDAKKYGNYIVNI